MSDGLTVSLLGPLRASRDGEPVALGGRQQQAVLVRLALAGGDVVASERLVDDLWSGDPPATATNTLQSYVSNLRRALGPSAGGGSVIERVGDGYRLLLDEGGLATARFERLFATAVAMPPSGLEQRVEVLEEALALWHGDAVADFADEPWARGDAVRLEELRLAAVEARFQGLLDLGRHALVVGDLDAAARANPLREQLTTQLVLALYRCGRQAEALRAYERTRRHLGEELGLDPGPSLVRLAERVAAQDPSLLEAPPVAASSAPDAVAGPSAPTESRRPVEVVGMVLSLPPAVAERRARSPFVGRAEELAQLERAWERVADPDVGGARLVTVSGEPGLGKTRLAQQLARRVHDGGGHVLWGRCSVDQLIAYQPIVEALRTAVRSIDPRFGPALVTERPALAPILAGPGTEGASGLHGAVERPTDDLADRGERYELFEALATLLGDVTSGAPVLLVIDDLQWADTATLALLDHLLHHARSRRLLVVATVRRPAGRPTQELDRFLTDLRRGQRLEQVELRGFDSEEVRLLLGQLDVAVDPDLARSVQDRTGGNPFFVESLAERGGDLAVVDDRSIPGSVREVFDQRLSALDAATTGVLTAAAVVGLRVELDLLAAVTDSDVDAVLDAVDNAVAAGLLVEDEELGWVAFPHALVRQALIARLSRNREALLHLRVADVVEGRHHALDRADTVAQHLVAAGRACPPARAAAAALEAGHGALSVVADEEALIWARRALAALAPAVGAGGGGDPTLASLHGEATLLLARATRYLGRLDEARQATAQAADAARRLGDGMLLMRAAQESALLAGAVGWSYGSVDEQLVALLDEALDALGPDHPAERAALLAWGSIARHGGIDRDLPEQMSIAAMEAFAGSGGHRHVEALTLYARRLAVSGPSGLDERLSLARPLREAASGWTELEAVGRILAIIDLLEAARAREAEAALEELRAFVAPVLRPALDGYVALLDSLFALLRGDVARAQERADHALTIGTASHGTNAAIAWAGQSFMVAFERGGLAAYRDQLARLVVEAPTISVWVPGLACSLVEAGELEEARRTARLFLVDGRVATSPHSALYPMSVGLLAEVCWATQDEVLADPLLLALAPISHRVALAGMGATCLGPLIRHQGLALAVSGDLDGADAQLQLASELTEELGWPTWRARADAERATVLDRRGGPGDAELAADLRARARATAEELGITLSLAPEGAPEPA